MDQYVYSPIDFCTDCYAAGFRVGKGLATIIAIAGAETAGTFDPQSSNTAGNTPPSTDRGIIEINSYWHPEVTDACAYDPKCAAVAGFRISAQGTSFTPWATYNNGAYKRYLPVAWMAIDAFQRISKLQADKDTAVAAQAATLQKLVEAGAKVDSQNLIIDALNARLAELTSADQKRVEELLGEISSVTQLRDEAVVRAEAAEGKVEQITHSLDQYVADFRKEILG